MSNYRPISILSTFSKILEKLIYNRTQLFLEKHSIILPTQYGFRPAYSTSLAMIDILSRGGVEDTRLEAKTKDTKKIRGQGQGQPFRGQTLSRPRTGMLEAKDQGHKRLCSPKKKGPHTKIFRAISKKKKGLHKNFSSDLHKQTFSKKFFKRSTKF